MQARPAKGRQMPFGVHQMVAPQPMAAARQKAKQAGVGLYFKMDTLGR
jgi:hypothetical protein